MTIKEFVEAVKIQTSDSAVRGTLQCLDRPPGRKPRKHLVQLSEWYRQLGSKDQAMLADALKEAAEMAVFEFFCVVDGVSVIEDTSEKGDLELYFVKAGDRTWLNDPKQHELHNLFNALCQERQPIPETNPKVEAHESGEAQQLRSRLNPTDDLDIHHVPDKYLSMQNNKDYDPKTAPAIALPKLEHRQIPPSS
jgi:hypothetical protein